MLPNNYGLRAPGSYGLQLPPGFESIGAWGSPDVPNPLSGLTGDGAQLYKSSNALEQLPGSFAGQINAAAAVPAQGDWLSNFGGKDGWGGTAISGLGALASTFLGMKQYGLAKQTLEENKRQFQLNYDAQKQMTNTRLEDRQRARVASNAGAYQSVGDYMATNGVK